MSEFDYDLAQIAIRKAEALSAQGKQLKVLTGDVGQKLGNAIATLVDWRRSSCIDSMLVTIHALLHELPHRGSKTTDIEALLAHFFDAELPGRIIIREPCAPRDLPATVYLHANCTPSQLASLADRVRRAHPHVFDEAPPVPMYDKVRMSSRLAIETIVK